MKAKLMLSNKKRHQAQTRRNLSLSTSLKVWIDVSHSTWNKDGRNFKKA